MWNKYVNNKQVKQVYISTCYQRKQSNKNEWSMCLSTLVIILKESFSEEVTFEMTQK
jgi:hypothetical protein